MQKIQLKDFIISKHLHYIILSSAEPWFDRIPRALSAADMYWLRNSAAVFHYAVELFAEISKRVPSGLLILHLLIICNT